MTTSPAIRRSTIERRPLRRRVFAPRPRKPLPRWIGRLLLGLLALLLLAAGLVACRESTRPQDLAHSVLTGRRLVTGPVCLEEAVDVSGSMAAFRPQRERAERALFAFATRELQDDVFAEARVVIRLLCRD